MGLLDTLSAYWTLDETGLGDTRVDSSPNSFDLVAVGTGVNPATGQLNGCTRGTQNTANYLQHAADDPLFSADPVLGLTVNCRCLIPAGTLTVNHPILAHYANTQRGWLLFGQNSTDEFTMVASNDGTTSGAIANWGVDYLVDTWYMVTGYLDPANNRVGIQVDNGTIVWVALTAPFFNSNQGLTHQLFNGSSPVAGGARVDELGLWQRVLTTDELNELWNGGGAPPAFSTFTSDSAGEEPAEYNYFWSGRTRQEA